MKRIIISFLLGSLISLQLSGQSDDAIRSISFVGPVSGKTIHFGIYFPPGYHQDKKNYPVVYHLHGLWEEINGGNNQFVVSFYESRFNSNFREFIIVFPDGKEGVWGDKYDGNLLVETNFIKEVLPYVEENYRIDTKKRIIEGWSSGAVGAMTMCAKYPNLFNKALILDGPFFDWSSFKNLQPYFANNFFNNDSTNYSKLDPYFLVESTQSQIKDTNMIRFKMISSTYLSKPNYYFQQLLQSYDIYPEFIEVNCGHEIQCVMNSDAINIINFLSLD